MLLAPILMVQHTRVVLVTALGWRASWNGQQRGACAEDWRHAAVRYGGCTLFGALWAIGVYLTAPDLLPWLSPVLAGLLLAVPIAVLSSRAGLGLAALRHGWFLIPEEIAPPKELEWLALEANPSRHPAPEQPRVPILASEPAAPSSRS
ncbi:MAG: hypothetical protein ACRECF_09395, partial [Methyloceanibacter sp.]